jgi:hypothetical protein
MCTLWLSGREGVTKVYKATGLFAPYPSQRPLPHQIADRTKVRTPMFGVEYSCFVSFTLCLKLGSRMCQVAEGSITEGHKNYVISLAYFVATGLYENEGSTSSPGKSEERARSNERTEREMRAGGGERGR